jgi:tetratricopeptide (TPR) repeat protein
VKFIIRRGDQTFEFPLKTGLYVAGRDASCEIVLDSKKVSRRHVSFTVETEEVIARDLGSRNGIYVSGVRVKEGRLGDGDVVKVGDFELVFSTGTAMGTHEPLVGAAAGGGEPDEEETPPADEELLLPAVRGESQPQLLEQDGKLFVVDPGTGRQVEIVPVRPELAAKPVAVSRKGPSRRTMRLLMIGLGALVLLLVVAAIVKQSQPPPGPGLMSKRRYRDLLDQGIRAVESGEIQEGGLAIETARAGRPKDEEGDILRDIAIRWNTWMKEFLGHSDEMEGLLRELRRFHATPTCIAFTDKWIRRIRYERMYSGLVYEAQKQIKAGELEAALETLAKIPSESFAAKKYGPLVAQTRQELITQLAARAAAAEGAQRWSSAVRALDKLIEHDPARKAEYEKRKAACLSHEADRQALAEAQRLGRRRDYADALAQLGRIGQRSPYSTKAREMEVEIHSQQRRFRAQVLYGSGQGGEALELLKGDTTSGAEVLEARIQRVLAARELALAAKEKGDLDAEQNAWLAVQEAESDENNAYRREALRELARFRDRLKTLSDRYYEEGREAFQKADYAAARKLFEKALRVDPDRETGAAMLKEMSRRGALEYNRGLNAEAGGETEKAREHYRLAMAMGSPEDDFYIKAQERIKGLPK